MTNQGEGMTEKKAREIAQGQKPKASANLICMAQGYLEAVSQWKEASEKLEKALDMLYESFKFQSHGASISSIEQALSDFRSFKERGG
jgi:hypothetical protein